MWQVKRRSWKLDLLKDLEDRTTAPPVPLPFDQESLENLGQAHHMFSLFLNLLFFFSQSFPLFCFSTWQKFSIEIKNDYIIIYHNKNLEEIENVTAIE